MKITNAKLKKGTYLEVSFSDGVVDVFKSYPHTEAPPKLVKAFQSLNHHLTEMTEQYDNTGQPDYDNIVVRSYSIKGEDDKEGIVLTGVRTLKTGKVIVLNSPFTGLEVANSSYDNIKTLVEKIDNCRIHITAFMDNNKSQEDIQGKLFNANPDNVILKSQQPRTNADGEPETAIDIIFKEEQEAMRKNREDSNKDLTEQQKMDINEPVTVDQLKAAAKVRQLTAKEQQLLQSLNAEAKKGKRAGAKK